MIIDLTNVDTTSFLDKEGTFTLKVVKVDESKFTQNNNQVLEVTLKTKDDEFYTEQFVITEKALWKLKLFTKALKMPNVVDTKMMLHRYVIGEFKYEDYTKKDGTQMKVLKCVKWHPSKHTNTLTEEPQIPQQPVQTTPQQQVQQPEPLNIDDDEIPF